MSRRQALVPHSSASAPAIGEVMGIKLVTDTMGGLFWHRVTQSPDAIGFRYEKEDWTNAGIGLLAGRIRAALKREGAESGTRIAAFMYNSPFLLALFMACA